MSGEVVSTGPVCISFDDSDGDDNPALVTFVGGDMAVSLADKTDIEVEFLLIKIMADLILEILTDKKHSIGSHVTMSGT